MRDKTCAPACRGSPRTEMDKLRSSVQGTQCALLAEAAVPQILSKLKNHDRICCFTRYKEASVREWPKTNNSQLIRVGEHRQAYRRDAPCMSRSAERGIIADNRRTVLSLVRNGEHRHDCRQPVLLFEWSGSVSQLGAGVQKQVHLTPKCGGTGL